MARIIAANGLVVHDRDEVLHRPTPWDRVSGRASASILRLSEPWAGRPPGLPERPPRLAPEAAMSRIAITAAAYRATRFFGVMAANASSKSRRP
jgi:hypothetical protein